VSNVKILASIRLKGKNDNIKVKIPTCDIFVHSVYIESAQQVFYDPLLFYHKNGNLNQIQKNKRYIREIISYAVDETIRKMMPFDHILQEYLKNALEDNAEYTSSESEGEEEDSNDDNVLNNDKIIESLVIVLQEKLYLQYLDLSSTNLGPSMLETITNELVDHT
jgi:hypothetical protein